MLPSAGAVVTGAGVAAGVGVLTGVVTVPPPVPPVAGAGVVVGAVLVFAAGVPDGATVSEVPLSVSGAEEGSVLGSMPTMPS